MRIRLADALLRPARSARQMNAKRLKNKLAIVSPFPIRKSQKKKVAPLTLGQEEYDVSRCPTFPNGVAHATSLKADSEEPALFGTHAGRAKR